jgi:REP element-mobilizing transposase RayT
LHERHEVMDNSIPTAERLQAWHICWQAAMGREFLTDESVTGRIRERLFDAHQGKGRTLLDFVLMPAEIHVISRLTAHEGPGAVARAIANVVSRWVRDLHGVRGPVFAGRYRAYRIDSDEALKNDIRMLAWRPVVLGLCRTPTHYANSALRATLGLKRPMGFDARPLLDRMGSTVPEARAVLRAWIARRPGAAETREWELSRGLQLAVGSVGPASRMTREVRGASATLVAGSESQSIDGALELLERWVCAKLGMHDVQTLEQLRGAQGARGRALVAILAVQMELCSAASVARYFKRAKATLSEQMAACRRRPADRVIMNTPLARIVDEAVAISNGCGSR